LPDDIQFSLDEPMQEMLEYLTGTRPETEAQTKKVLKTARVTVEFLNLMCITGFATLFALARRGDRRASQYLIDRFMGLPDRPFREEVQAMDALTSAKTLYRELKACGHSAPEALAQVERLSARALSTAGQQLRHEDLED
jgi:hypothetical protein